jgi:hypothetical protein
MDSNWEDDYHGDMSQEEYDQEVDNSQMEYAVWVGGTEVNDKWLTYDEAISLYDKYKAQGYDDIKLDARIKKVKEGSFWGRDDMVKKMKDGEKASGMKKFVKIDDKGNHHGTSTSDKAKWKELIAQGYEEDKGYYDESLDEWVQEPHEGQKWSGQERNFIQELCLRMDGVSKSPEGLKWMGKSKTWDEGNVLSDKGKLTTVMLWAKRNIDDLYDRMGSEFKVYSDGNDEGDSGRGQSDGNQIIQNIIGKIGTIGEDSNLDEEELTEWVWVLPALATAARVGGPALLKLLKHGAKKAAPVAANTGTAIIKNPGTTLSWAAGGYVFKSVYDIVEKVKDVVGDLMDDTSVESFAEIVWKYKLPVAAVVAVLYGGKKLKDYMAGEEDKGNTTINNYYGSDQQPATENQDRMRHLAGIKTTPTLAVIKNTH